MTMSLLIGLLIGGIIVLSIVKVEGSFAQREENRLLKIKNQILLAEREERKIRIGQNEADIKLLKDKDKEREEQIITCLNLLTSVSSIRNQIELNTHIIATERYRKLYGLSNNTVDKPTLNDTYISKD